MEDPKEGPTGQAPYRQGAPGPGQIQGWKMVSWFGPKTILPISRGALKRSSLDAMASSLFWK